MTAQKPPDRPPTRSAERSKIPAQVIYITAAIISMIAVAVVIIAAGTRPASTALVIADATAAGEPATGDTALDAGLPASYGPQVEPHGHDANHPGSRDYSPGPPAPPNAEALAAIGRFATTWARPNIGGDQWWQEIAPLCEPGFAARLKTTDPVTIPATTARSAPAAAQSRTDLVTATVATDTGILTVTAALIGGQWLITGNDYTRTVS